MPLQGKAAQGESGRFATMLRPQTGTCAPVQSAAAIAAGTSLGNVVAVGIASAIDSGATPAVVGAIVSHCVTCVEKSFAHKIRYGSKYRSGSSQFGELDQTH